MNDYWQQLEPRQRSLVALAVAVLLATLVYVWIWEPLSEARSFERERIAGQQALLNWLEAVTPVAEALRSRESGARDLEGRSLLGLADETARAAGLAGALTRIEPGGEDQVRVWLDGADFVSVMGWLESFSRSRPVRIEQLQIDRVEASSGQVNVRVTVASDA